METTLLFIILMVVGTAFLGFNDIQKKKCLNSGLDAQVVLCASFLGSGILLALPLLYFGVPTIEGTFWYALAGSVGLNLVSQNFFIRALKYSDASAVAPLRLIIPPLVIVTGFFFLKEVPSIQGVIGIGITMIGLWFLLFPNFKPTLKLEKGIAYGLIGSVLFAISSPLDKITVVTSSALFASSLNLFSLGVLFTLYNTVRDRKFISKMFVTATEHTRALSGIFLFYAIGNVMTNQALNYSLIAYASSLKRLQAVWTILFAGTFLKEENIGKRLAAAVVMFAGVLISVAFQ